MQEVTEVLQHDAANRFRGITGDLHKLEDLRTKTWELRLPTLVSRAERKLTVTDSVTLKQKLLNRCSVLSKLDWNRCVVAGGCITNILGDLPDAKDVDVFLVNTYSDTEAKEVIRDFLTAVGNKVRLVFRNGYCVTIRLKKVDIQFILRRYSSLSEVLHSFDLGASAIGFDGTQVYTTTLGKFAYEYGYNIVDPSRRSPSYEFRLSKYHWQKNFGVIFPQLDITTLHHGEFKIGNALLRCERVQCNEITGSISATRQSDYGGDDDLEDNPCLRRSLALKAFLQQETGSYYEEGGVNYTDLWKNNVVTEKQIRHFFTRLIERAVDQQVLWTSSLPLKWIQPLEFCQGVWNKDIEGLWSSLHPAIHHYLQVLKRNEMVIIDTVPSDAHMLGSFQPLPCTADTWYGKYKKEE